MKSLLVVLALVLGVSHANAETAIKTGEETSGTSKQCYYSYKGSTFTLTVQNVDLCPQKIEVEAP